MYILSEALVWKMEFSMLIGYIYSSHFFSMFHGLMDLCYYTLSFSVSFLADIDQSTM